MFLVVLLGSVVELASSSSFSSLLLLLPPSASSTSLSISVEVAYSGCLSSFEGHGVSEGGGRRERRREEG